MISRKPKLRRQKKLFKQKGKVLRPDQMNINVAAWGRLIKNKNLSSSTSNADSQHIMVQRSLSDEHASSPMGTSIGGGPPTSSVLSAPSGADSNNSAFPLTPISSQASIVPG